MIKATYLEGHLLLAMPGMTDPRFDRSVIYMCSHSEEGAMGLVINSRAANIDFAGLLEQLDVKFDPEKFDPETLSGEGASAPSGAVGEDVILHAGGPVEVGRGFILHTADYTQESTMVISETIALTATIDILADISRGVGPKNYIVALGYTGWGEGQLEEEINRNSWLNIEADEELLFRTDLDLKWARAMAKLGVDITLLSIHAGNA